MRLANLFCRVKRSIRPSHILHPFTLLASPTRDASKREASVSTRKLCLPPGRGGPPRPKSEAILSWPLNVPQRPKVCFHHPIYARLPSTGMPKVPHVPGAQRRTTMAGCISKHGNLCFSWSAEPDCGLFSPDSSVLARLAHLYDATPTRGASFITICLGTVP